MGALGKDGSTCECTVPSVHATLRGMSSPALFRSTTLPWHRTSPRLTSDKDELVQLLGLVFIFFESLGIHRHAHCSDGR